MALLTASNNPITADGTYTVAIDPGRLYAFGASSAAWNGSLAVGWADEAGNVTAFPGSPLTANGNFNFIAPGKVLVLTASGTIGTTLISYAKADDVDDLDENIHETTAKTTLVDADEISITDSAASYGNKRATLTNLWTWIVTKLGALTSLTVGGSWNFASATRPISSATGLPAATSLMMRDDCDARYLQTLVSRVTTNTDNATTTLTDTGLTAWLTPGTWEIYANIFIVPQAYSTEPGVYVSSANTGTMAVGAGYRRTNGSGETINIYGISSLNGLPTASTLEGCGDANLEWRFTLNVTADGVFKFQFKQNASSVKYLRLYAGSYMTATKLA